MQWIHNSANESAPLLRSLRHVLALLSRPAVEEDNCDPNMIILALQQHGWEIDLQQQVGGVDIGDGLSDFGVVGCP